MADELGPGLGPVPLGPPVAPNSYLVGSYLPFAPTTPTPQGPLPPGIKVVHRMVIVESSNEQAAVNLFAGWDNVPVGTRYFSFQVQPYAEVTAMQMGAEAPPPGQ